MVLAKTDGCLAPLEARLVPTLVSILDATATSSVAAGDHNSKDGTVSTGLAASNSIFLHSVDEHLTSQRQLNVFSLRFFIQKNRLFAMRGSNQGGHK